jgi:DNA mismatch repair protein MutH
MSSSKNKKNLSLNKKENKVVHVRPHAKNKDDVQLFSSEKKVIDLKTLCFWLNATYIRDEIYLK